MTGRIGLLLHGPPGDGTARAVLARAERAGARLVAAEAGLSGALGEARWRVLWPRAGAIPDGNDASVTVDIRGGGMPDALFLGDLSGQAQRLVAAQGTLRAGYRVVKVAHHGSADQDPALYERLHAALAVISVGENSYGHPRDRTLAFLQADRSRVVRTDRSGDIAIWSTPRGLALWRQRTDVAGGR